MVVFDFGRNRQRPRSPSFTIETTKTGGIIVCLCRFIVDVLSYENESEWFGMNAKMIFTVFAEMVFRSRCLPCTVGRELGSLRFSSM